LGSGSINYNRCVDRGNRPATVRKLATRGK